jgi:hypothetical protein
VNRLIADSPTIQYTIRTTLCGVSDRLDPLSNHLDAFDQWETAWREIDLRKPNASIDEPVLAANDPDIEYSLDDISPSMPYAGRPSRSKL